ncbi:uncharacterized protein K489DRAFT_325584, partial [Dissoconium aciculare CBS 342.82]|uniref:DRBM domain-containing protein n=1 Tax=Dissoconium aciculare CBS 342.82 TaxID=1314786 RepID=A0A6J3LUE0_9PEZI
CLSSGRPAPRYQVVSDRRGGRTAWSAVVEVAGITYRAQFWYDGQYVNNAKEDAAEKALQAHAIYQSRAMDQVRQ